MSNKQLHFSLQLSIDGWAPRLATSQTMCDLQQETTLHDRDSHSILITSVITWYEVDEVAAKALERRRSSGASVHRKLDPALLQGTRLTVQLQPVDVLDAADMPMLNGPLRLDALVVEETHPEGESRTSMSAWMRIVVSSAPLVRRR